MKYDCGPNDVVMPDSQSVCQCSNDSHVDLGQIDVRWATVESPRQDDLSIAEGQNRRSLADKSSRDSGRKMLRHPFVLRSTIGETQR